MEERKDKGVDKKERRKGDVKIGGRVASGGHRCLQGKQLTEKLS